MHNGKLIINLHNGSIEADADWLNLNEIEAGTEVDSAVLQSTIAPNDLPRFKSYSKELIVAAKYDEPKSIELNLLTARGKAFLGEVTSRKLKGQEGDYIESTVRVI